MATESWEGGSGSQTENVETEQMASPEMESETMTASTGAEVEPMTLDASTGREMVAGQSAEEIQSENEAADAEAAAQEQKAAEAIPLNDEVQAQSEREIAEAQAASAEARMRDDARIEQIRAELQEAPQEQQKPSTETGGVSPVTVNILTGGGGGGFERGGGSQSSSVEQQVKYKECDKCKGSGKRLFIFNCRICKGTGRVVDSHSVKQTQSVSN